MKGIHIISVQTLVALKTASCVMWQLECQASSDVAASVQLCDQLQRGTGFQSFSPLINRIVHHALLKIRLQPVSRQADGACKSSVSRIGT